MAETITVVIADDQPIFRHELRQIIETDPQLRVLADVGDGEEAWQTQQSLRPTVAVLDVTMPLKDGFAGAHAASEARLPVSLVFLTMHKDEHYLTRRPISA